ncbi:MAG TPA: energy-coupling factor ABC transporter substrate-binding protein [Epulopiscium sp.]|nr:energy-coupling factor ABC transporter substrate-binding protein [Candidatus Epulonipiscium sp.]
MKNKSKNIILIAICLVILIVPFMLHRDSEFEGSDAQGEDMIMALDKTYEPWVSPIFPEIPGEIETLLFTIQAAIGGGFIGYYMGRKNNAKGNSSIRQS